jgi:DNA-binding transcriptional LysR family regulator
MIETDGVEIAKKYVQMGFGIAVVSSFSLTQEDNDTFWCHDVSHLFGKVKYGIYYRRDRYFTMTLKQFIRVFSTKLYETFLSLEMNPTSEHS